MTFISSVDDETEALRGPLLAAGVSIQTCCCDSDPPASPILGAYASGPHIMALRTEMGLVESSFKSLCLKLGHPASHLGCQEGDREALS